MLSGVSVAPPVAAGLGGPKPTDPAGLKGAPAADGPGITKPPGPALGGPPRTGSPAGAAPAALVPVGGVAAPGAPGIGAPGMPGAPPRGVMSMNSLTTEPPKLGGAKGPVSLASPCDRQHKSWRQMTTCCELQALTGMGTKQRSAATSAASASAVSQSTELLWEPSVRPSLTCICHGVANDCGFASVPAHPRSDTARSSSGCEGHKY